MSGQVLAPVPLSGRWQWAKLQAKVEAEGGTPPEEWRTAELDAPAYTSVAHWIYMLRWPPATNGDGIIVTSRTRFGRIATLLVLLVGIGVVVGTFRRWPVIGAALGMGALPVGVANLAHVITTWRTRGQVTYLANFVRHPPHPRAQRCRCSPQSAPKPISATTPSPCTPAYLDWPPCTSPMASPWWRGRADGVGCA